MGSHKLCRVPTGLAGLYNSSRSEDWVPILSGSFWGPGCTALSATPPPVFTTGLYMVRVHSGAAGSMDSGSFHVDIPHGTAANLAS